MADLYQPPSYQRPLKGVVTAIGNERNPITRVGITRRGVEMELNAYAETNPDDDAGVAVKVGDGVLIEKTAAEPGAFAGALTPNWPTPQAAFPLELTAPATPDLSR